MTPPAPPPAPPPAGRPARLWLPLHRRWATYLLLGAIGLVFLGQLALAPGPADVDPILAWGAKVNALILQGEWWRLITPIFIHGSLLHFAFNAYALYSLGGEIERFYGGGRFLVLFFYAGLAGSAASFVLSPAASVGASGAIFGLIAAQAVLLYRNRRLLGERARAGLQNILLIAAVNLFIGLQAGSRIDNWAHLGGLAGGLAMAWALGPVWQLEARPQEPFAPPALALVDPGAGGRGWAAAGALVVLLGAGLAAVIGLSG